MIKKNIIKKLLLGNINYGRKNKVYSVCLHLTNLHNTFPCFSQMPQNL